MKTAIVFLCKEPHEETKRFVKQINAETDFYANIVSDNLTIEGTWITDEECRDKGFVNSNISDNSTHIKKNPIAWDKFLYQHCLLKSDYDFVWVFEEDCFIPSIETLVKLNEKYSEYDLVTPNNFINLTNKMQDWHWRHIYDKIKPPYYYSMVCGCGMSRKMLDTIKGYVEKNNTLFYIEAMFNTLAMQNGLKVTDAKELKSIVWLGEWELDEFLLLPNNVFHPLKDIGSHQRYRIDIENAKNKGYKPINRLPEFCL